MDISFFKINNAQLVSYNSYVATVNNENLLELNGFKIRNILSIVFDLKSRKYVLDDLFNEDGTFLSSDTKNELFRNLSTDERDELREYLRTYLNYQIESEWFTAIRQICNDRYIKTVVVPSVILNHDLILDQLKELLPNTKFTEWSAYEGTSKTLILDYNQAWKRRNIFTLNDGEIYAYFLHHFFENEYEWKIFNDEKHFFNGLNTQTRVSLFGEGLLDEVKAKLKVLRPEQKKNEWDVLHEKGHNYSFNPQEEIIIHFNDKKNNKYRINSDFLLADDNRHIIKSAKDLAKNPTQFEGKFKISNLETIVDRIDLNKLNQAIEKNNSIAEIILPLWDKYKLNENDGRLWKQLLAIKSKEVGIQKVYAEIEEISGLRNFVSLSTFERTYCNPRNDSIIPREKKVFRAICQYLGLPPEYRAAIHRERNLIGGRSQELNSKLKELIKSIVENEVLDKIKNDENLFLNTLDNSIENIINEVDMEYFGFTEDTLKFACLELCYEIILKINLKPIHKIEKVQPN